MLAGALEDVKMPYSNSEPPNELTIDDSTFSNTDSHCLIQSCSFHPAGDCEGEAFSAPDSLVLPTSPPWTIQALKSIEAGYRHDLCVSCSNGYQTASIDNWSIVQCGEFKVGETTSVKVGYESGSVNDLELMSTFFINQPGCEITTCALYDLGCVTEFTGLSD